MSCFKQLISLYDVKLMRFLNMRCKNQQDAEDIFQETFINVLKYIDSYRTEYAFSTWLFNIAFNLIKKRPQLEQELGDNLVAGSDTSAPISSSNIWIVARSTLENEQLCLLWFIYAEGYTGSQAAEILDRSLAWVKINLVRAKQKLREKLTEQGVGLIDLLEG
ncbi:MAG: RNA polymerase sigma factor [Kangiellaceae bacterium]|nr:RNA polymerase sigma factor [Kangiellaceae bacterium]